MVTRTAGAAKGCDRAARRAAVVVLRVAAVVGAWSPVALLMSAAVSIATPAEAAAQQAADSSFERVPRDSVTEGLVLGGGGSRGLAHAGVLVGLERKGYDADLVVGTSMGAIIGALYAAGYAPEDVVRTIEAIDWPRMFQPPAVSLGPGDSPRRPMLRVAVPSRGVRPQGLLPEAYIDRILVRLLFDAGARSGGDFDRLPRRFRAVAVELRTGERRVLGSGDLARAVRASMAIPGLFPPILEADGDILVDGGIVDNVAVDVARDAGAEHVVASDVIAPDTGAVGYDAIRIGVRGLRLLLHVTRDTAKADVTIRPALPEALPALIFPRDASSIIREGMAAVDSSVVRASQPASARVARPAPDRLTGPELEGAGRAMVRLAHDAFDPATREPYSADAVLRAVDRLYATELVEGVWPRVDSAGKLTVRVEARPALQVAFAGAWENDVGWRGWLALQGLSAVGAAPLSSTLAASADALDRELVAAARLHAWTPPLALVAGFDGHERDIRTFLDDSVAETASVRRVGGWLGLETRRFAPEWLGSLRLQGGRIEGDVESGFGGGPVAALEEVQEEGEPVGTPTKLEIGYRAGTPRYGWLHARGSVRFHAADTRAAVVAELQAVGTDAPADIRPAHGDDRRMPGLRRGEERGRDLALVGLDVAHSVPFGADARLRLRAGHTADGVRRLTPIGAWSTGLEVGLLWTTPLGDLDVAYGLASGHRGRTYVSVGSRF